MVLGPNLVKSQFSSGDLVKMLMVSCSPGMPHVSVPFVDVRDVAQAHLQAILVPEAKGQRFILWSCSIFLADLGKIIAIKYGRDYRVTTNTLPKWLCWGLSKFNKEIATMYPMWGVEQTFDTSATKKVLGITFIQP